MNLFGKKKTEDIRSKIYDSIILLADTIESQQKRKNHIEKQMNDFEKEARQYVNLKKKENAMLSLKKKKMCEKQIKIIDNSIFNLEIQKINLENSDMYKSTLEAFTQASIVLKESSVDIEKVEDIMDELQYQFDKQEEVSQALSRPLVIIDVDDEMRELEEMLLLEDEKVVKIKPKSFTYEDLPNVPKQEEEDIEDIKKSLELI